MVVLGIGQLHPILDCIALKSLYLFILGCAVSSLLCKLFSVERGSHSTGVSGLLIAVVPLGSMGTGACGLQSLLGVGSTLAVARI